MFMMNARKIAWAIILVIGMLTACSDSEVKDNMQTANNTKPANEAKVDKGAEAEPATAAEPETIEPKTHVFGEGTLYENGQYVEYATFSPNENTIYLNKLIFSPLSGILYESQLTDGVWSEPTIPSYAEEDTWESHSVVSFDDKRVLFNSKRDSGDVFYIWEAIRNEDGTWGKPKKLFEGFQPALAADGTLYFTRDPLKLYRAVWVDGAYTEPELIEGPINGGLAMSPYVAPDESYLIFSKNDMKLYLSYREDDKWTEPTPLLNKNGTIVNGFAAYVSHNQKTLYTFAGQESTKIYSTDISMVDIKTP
jgi:hypothetical protein